MITAAANHATCLAAWKAGLERGSATNPHATTTQEFSAWNLGARCWGWAETWAAIRTQEKKK